MRDIQPGTFFEENLESESNKNKKKDPLDLNIDYSGIRFDIRELKSESEYEQNFETGSVKQISLFKDAFNPKADVIYYPCSEFDLSVNEVFPDSRVIYADINYEVFEALKNKGLDVHHVSALQFNPGSVDILFLFNPQIDPYIPASFVKSGGYVICNDYHATAQKMATDKKFEIVGVIGDGEDGKQVLITDSLNDYVTLVEDVDLEDSMKVFQTARKKSASNGYFIFRKK